VGPQSGRIESTIRFGRDFELDPGLFELRRSGRVLRLERIPMEILLLLARERGRVVTRQEIADAVWGKGTSLDADNSINGAIRKIRYVLRDDPDQPRYILTVTGRGYRFIAPVAADQHDGPDAATDADAGKEADSSGLAGATPAEASGRSPEPTPDVEPDVDAKPRARSTRRWTAIGVAAAAVLIAVAGILFWTLRAGRRPAAPEKLRLAVLPFQNLTGDPSQDYLSDGFTEEMITQLGRLDPQHLAVIARTSVMNLKGTSTPLKQIAADLDVQYVVEGSVRRDAANLRITAQLIAVKDQTHVWAREYDRQPTDLLEIQSEIGHEIAREIQLALGGRSPNPPPGNTTLSAQEYVAYDQYLKGRYLWSKRTADDLQGAVYWFKQAIAADPNYARAYAGLADAYTIQSGYGYVSSAVYMPLARTAALKALQLDPSLAEAHTSLALIAQNYDWDWHTAEAEYRRAIELNANYATAHHWFAECLAFQGRFDEAFEESERARQLDPLSSIIAADNGAIYYFSRQYDRAISRFRAVLDVDPGNGRAHMIIYAYVQEKRFKEAQDDLAGLHRRGEGPWVWALQAYVDGRAGDTAKTRRDIEKLEAADRTSKEDPDPLLNVAYAGLGDKEKWIAAIEKAYRDHTNLPTNLKVDPLYDPLRGDPRFQRMLHGAGFDR
jgi:TolB-like protein/DNA-binding winged helix-turn-helix (wHTH) protein/Tfp pilus assembly protein PilF